MRQILKPNTDRIAREIIEDEVIIIDLELGNYYNLAGTAADIWLLLEQQPTQDDLIAAIADRYATDRAAVAASVQSFVEELSNELLIVSEAGTQPSANQAFGIPTDPQRVFTAPVLDKFTNMSDLLLLDPIHDVDNNGWPIAKTAD